MDQIFILLLMILVIATPLAFLIGFVMAFSENPKEKKIGLILLLASLIIIVIGYSICSNSSFL